MGTDIHMFLEIKSGDGPWEADKIHKEFLDEDDNKCIKQLPFTSRDYLLFRKLAGVRGNGPQAKGLPEDCSDIIRNNTTINEYGDDHSHSFSSFEELKQAMQDSNFDLDRVEMFRHITTTINWARVNNDLIDADRLRNLVDYDNRWYALIAYIDSRMLSAKTELEVEKQLLGQDINTNVEARVVYWFDN